VCSDGTGDHGPIRLRRPRRRTEEHGLFGLEMRTDLVAQRVNLTLTGHDLTG
jgi:hypothetical protein